MRAAGGIDGARAWPKVAGFWVLLASVAMETFVIEPSLAAPPDVADSGNVGSPASPGLAATGPVVLAPPAEGDWGARPFNYAVVDQDLRQVLQEFGRNLGVLVRIGDDVHGHVRNLGRCPDAKSFLDKVAADQNLVWYDDGATIHVASADDIQSKIVSLSGVSFEQLSEALGHLGLSGKRFGVRPSTNEDLVNVTGPRDFVALVEQTITTLGQQNAHDVRVLKGRSGGAS